MKPKPKTLGEVAMRAAIPHHSGESYNWSRAALTVIREYEKRQWRPVSVRPRKTDWVLVYNTDREVFEHYFNTKIGFPVSASHWRPMPKGPKQSPITE
jgi:hypothetical protein